MSKTRKADKPEDEKTAVNPALVKRDYRVLVTGWVAGRRVSEGDLLRLSESEARYEPVELIAGETKAAASE